jgi:hypothetical protein
MFEKARGGELNNGRELRKGMSDIAISPGRSSGLNGFLIQSFSGIFIGVA